MSEPFLEGTLTRALARTESLADLLARLHARLLDASGGTSAVVLQIDPRTGLLHATSAAGLSTLATDAWLASPGEANAAGEALATDRPLAIAGLRQQMPGLAARLEAPAALLVPLIGRAHPIGLLVVGCQETPDLDRIGRAVDEAADGFVLAFERARLERDRDLQSDLRHLLHEFSQSVSSALNLPAGVELFCQQCARLFAADGIEVWLLDRRARELVLTASSGTDASPRGTRVSVDDGLSVAAEGLRRARAELIQSNAGGDGPGPVSVVAPLRGRRRALGVVVLSGARIDAGGEMDLLDRVDEVVRQLSAGIENVQLLEDVLRSRGELENTFNSLSDLVAVCHLGGRIVRVNGAWADRWQQPRDAFADQPIGDFVGPAIRDWLLEHDEGSDAMAGAETREFDDPILHGTFAVTMTPLAGADDHATGFVIVVRDVTERTRLEAESAALRDRLTQSEKLAALGQFVAGIAHELNNPLQGVLGHIELLKRTGAFPPPIKREMQQVYREAERAARIVEKLLVFAGSRRLTGVRAINLNALLARIIAPRAPTCRRMGIDVVRTFDESLPKVAADGLLLHQALLNIVLNAEQALAGPGRIVVSTGWAPGQTAVEVRISDSGPGIPDHLLSRIFEPFFTTKDVGQGTGLGLAIAYGIVQEHGGRIDAANEAGGGARFTVTLPLEPPRAKMSRQDAD
jgi:signal transduction histidine kinase